MAKETPNKGLDPLPSRSSNSWIHSIIVTWSVIEVAMASLVLIAIVSGLPVGRVLTDLTGSADVVLTLLLILAAVVWTGDMTALILESRIQAADSTPLDPTGDQRSRPRRRWALLIHLFPAVPLLRRMIVASLWLAINLVYLVFLLLWDVAMMLLALPLRMSGSVATRVGRLTDMVDRFRERDLFYLAHMHRLTAVYPHTGL